MTEGPRQGDRERELRYYRRLLDELAAEKIRLDHHHWVLQTQLRQKRQGFQLLSNLAASIGPQTSVAEMLKLAALAIHARLGMDRAVVLEPAGPALAYRPTHWAGYHGDAAERLAGLVFEFPADFATRSGLLLVGTITQASPLVAALRAGLDVPAFACVPIMGEVAPLGLLLCGRELDGTTLFPALDQGDVDTLRAIGGVIEAVVRNARIARLEQTQRLKAELFANLSHEFRTPITLTLGPLERILAGHDGPLPVPVADKLRVVQRNQERLLGLINELLDLARLEAGGSRLRPARSPQVNRTVEERVAQFRPAADARGLTMTVSLDPRLDGADLYLDEGKFDRLLFNLLSNALKFTERGAVSVSTRLEDERFVLDVTDTGVGVRPEDLPHVFERFRRAHGAGVGVEAGTGIGLALVREIATLHGGEVAARSEQGKGSSFRVTIPLGALHLDAATLAEPVPRTNKPVPPAPEPAPRADGEAENRAAEARFDPQKPIVLYVEDDADLRAHVRDVLSRTTNVFVAVDGRDGLEKARRYVPDLVLTDQMMPEMSGRELLRALREDDELRAIPVIFLTAVAGTEGRIESLDAGADDYLCKPFSEGELLARVRNLVRARAQQRALVEMGRRLEARVEEQMSELLRAGELQRFLPRPLVESLLGGTLPDGLSRRKVTVLTADLSGLASLADRIEPEEMSGLFDEHLREAAAVATAFGGTLDGFASDRICLLFGAPAPAEDRDHAWAAVGAAIEIRGRVIALAQAARRRGIPAELGVRIGVSTGFCTVGAFGGDALRIYTAIGFARAASSALAADAGPGAIVVGEATWALVQDRVRGRALPRSAAGVRPLHAYELSLEPESAPALDADAPLEKRREVDAAAGGRLFRREGEYWTVAYEGRIVRLRDAKGARYLARLLARPRTDVFVLDLVEPPDGAEPEQPSASDLGDSGPLLDVRARAEYRERLGALREELEEARQFRDAGRVERVEMEIASLSRELAAAVGLGGRDRKTGSAAERARINVTRTIKSVIDKIAQDHPDLGRHLGSSVRTGMFCSYSPEPGHPAAWDVS